MKALAAAPALPRACFFGTYASGHTANRLLYRALENAGFAVDVCHVPLWERTRDKMPDYFGTASLARLGWAYARRARWLAAELRQKSAVDLFVVGFNGQLDVLLLRLLRRSARIAFAPLVTITETLVEDRKLYRPGSPMGRWIRWLDRASLRLADRVVVDTEAHRRDLIEQYGLRPEAVVCWYLGADRTVFRPAPPRARARPLRVLFYGQFLPLHGIQTILEAIAAMDPRLKTEFTIVGTGPERPRLAAGLERLEARGVRVVEWLPYDQLGAAVADADVCLGSFGTSEKARRVIPNKVYQAASVGRAVVTADTPAVREVFCPGGNIALCPAGDSGALAAALERLADDRERVRLAIGAQRLMAARFDEAGQAARLRAALSPLLEK